MFQRLWQNIKWAFGKQSIQVELETPARLELRFQRRLTAFDRTQNLVSQNGRPVAAIGMIEHIELRQQGAHSRGTPWWDVTLQVRGQRRVEVGRVTDAVDASTIGAHIATVTGCQVIVRQD